ncbi:MAG TPA: aspartate/glutamate racemase family protein [Sphingomonas sp.]
MKTIGLIGGMSWESSAHYYAIINRAVRDRLGGAHSARILLYSFDFGDIADLQHAGDWPALTRRMIDAARSLEAAGADFLLICTNTMHLMADDMAQAVAIPLLHVVDPTAKAVVEAGFQRVGLLGTAFTMEKAFYRDRLALAGLDVVLPDATDRRDVHRVIYDELVAGKIEPASRQVYRDIIARLVERGAQAIVLGCTEIMLLVDRSDATVPLFDTTELHALAAVDRALV